MDGLQASNLGIKSSLEDDLESLALLSSTTHVHKSWLIFERQHGDMMPGISTTWMRQGLIGRQYLI
jgi:hypothetical protein